MKREFPPFCASLLAIVCGWGLAAWASSATAGPTAAGPATAPPTLPTTLPALGDQDRAILQRLATGTWKQRLSAEEELSGWPPDREPTIHAMLAATTSPEAQARLQAVVLRMAERRSTGTSLITMNVKDASAKSVYAELFRQAWATMRTDPAKLLDDPKLPKLTVNVDQVPFWTVEQQLAKTTRIGLRMSPSGTYVLRSGASIEAGPQVISGPMLLVLAHAGLNRGPTRGHLELMVYGEPKIRVLLLNPQLKIKQAVDNKGNSLSTNPTVRLEGNPAGELCMAMDFAKPATNPGDRLTHLKAMLTVTVAMHPQHVVIDDVTHAASRDIHIGDFVVTFEGFKKQANGAYQATFSTKGADAQNRLLTLLQLPVGIVRAFDAHGKLVAPDGMSYSTFQNAVTTTSKVSYIYQARAGSPIPKQLTCDVPNQMKTIDVPMDFKDIDYPLSDDK